MTKLEGNQHHCKMQTQAQQLQKSTATKKIKTFGKISLPIKPVWLLMLKNKTASESRLSPDRLRTRLPCWHSGWSERLHAQNLMGKTLKTTTSKPDSNTSKRRKNNQKKRGSNSKDKKCFRKKRPVEICTHRAGVKCCNKNVKWFKIQYGGASPNAVPFL